MQATRFLNVNQRFASILARSLGGQGSNGSLKEYEKTLTLPSISKRHKLKIPYKLTYIDTDKHETTARTVLFIHGTPGTYEDFHLQIPFFQSKGVRVLSPNLPEYKFVHDTNRLYKHSPQDRADFVQSFLNELNVSKIDMLVSHSSGIYPSLILATSNETPEVNSLALLNPATHTISKSVKPVWWTKLLVNLGQRKLTYNILKIVANKLMQAITPVKIKSIDHPLFALTTILISPFKDVRASLDRLKESKLPSLLAYSQNDKLFETPVYEKMNNIFVPDVQLLQDLTWKFDENGELVKKGVEEDWIKILNLKSGTHYSMWKHPTIINENLLELLDRSSLTKSKL